MRLAPGADLGPYRIEAPIGAGGMGEVYRALDPRLGREVAIKVSAEQFTERFEREARAVAALNHPNICTLYDVGPNYLVMELIEGESPQGPLPLETALSYARQIGAALEAAHEKGIVHRDLKPANIKIKPDGSVKVLDFGLAKVASVAASAASADSPTISLAATQVGMILGTAAYMSPEQARGKPVDKRADIWAFGVVFYEMITGRQLFAGEDVSDTLATVIKSEPKWDGIPGNVQRLLKSCLEKDPSRRLRDIGDAWRLLEDIPAAPVTPGSRRTSPIWIAATAVLALALAVVALLHFREQSPQAPVTRFQVSPPENASFAGPDTNISPDGTKIAFHASVEGRNQVWLRSLDSLESRPVAGTEGIQGNVAWSPDSRFLVFPDQGKLKKVDVNGGRPQTLCDVPGGAQWRGGAWSKEGVILFGTSVSGLWRVSDAGGTPSPVTKLDSGRGELHHLQPVFLPDGRHFLYTRVLSSLDAGLYLGSLDAKPEEPVPAPLLATDSNAAYASDSGNSDVGHVLFTRDGSLMAQPFDTRRLKLSGEPEAIAELGSFSSGQRAFSASMTGVLAYRSGATGASDRIAQLRWFDREGKSLGTGAEAASYNTVSLSRDGTRAAVGRLDARARASVIGNNPFLDIWVYDFTRGASERLTSDPGSEWLATWSPDATQIIYSAVRGSSASDLYRKPANGAGNEELILKSDEDKSAQDWSRDGRFLIYSVTGKGLSGMSNAAHDLWVLPLTGSPADRKPEPYLKTEFNESQAKFSPDSRFVVYRSDSSGRDEIYVQPFPNATGGKWLISQAGGVQPRWSSDGRELYYIAPDAKLMAVAVSSNPVFKAGVPKALFQTTIMRNSTGTSMSRNATNYDVAPGGKKFLILSRMTETAGAGSITVVQNWKALLKK